MVVRAGRQPDRGIELEMAVPSDLSFFNAGKEGNTIVARQKVQQHRGRSGEIGALDSITLSEQQGAQRNHLEGQHQHRPRLFYPLSS